MAQRKNVQDYYEEDETLKPTRTSKSNDFILQDQKEVKATTPELSDEEQKLRQLKARFKKLRGYKPAGLSLEELRAAVNEAENQS